MSHTGWHKEHCFLSSVLISSLWHCCISAHLRLSISPALEDRTQQPNSWEFWGVWHLDWQQRTSKLFPASVPTPCQAVALIKGGPNYAHFYAIRGISFHRHGLFLFFFFITDKTFRKNAPLCVIPIRPQMLRQNVNSGHAAAVRVRSNIVGGFWFLVFMQHILLVDPNPLHLPMLFAFCFFSQHDFHFF